MKHSLTYENRYYNSKIYFNGEPVQDIELNEESDNKKQTIVGHYNSIPIHMKRLHINTKRRQAKKQKKRTTSKNKHKTSTRYVQTYK